MEVDRHLSTRVNIKELPGAALEPNVNIDAENNHTKPSLKRKREPREHSQYPKDVKTRKLAKARKLVHIPSISDGESLQRLEHWVQESSWPPSEDRSTRSDLSPTKSEHLRTQSDLVRTKSDLVRMKLNLIRPKSDLIRTKFDLLRSETDYNMSQSSKRTRSTSSALDSAGQSSAQRSRSLKFAGYVSPRYEDFLERKGSYMTDSKSGMLPEDKVMCQALLDGHQDVPVGTLFDDPFFDGLCSTIRRENETRVIRDISLLVTPSAEQLALRGLLTADFFKETVNEGWIVAIPFEGPRPQPDFSVGVLFSMFSEAERAKLGLDADLSLFAATTRMCFPFLTTEVKCGAQAMSIADRQNAHSATVAVRAIVELYTRAKRQQELHRKVLAFSISHDHNMVQIYAHYPEISGLTTKYYICNLKTIVLNRSVPSERWAAYRFVCNVYKSFAESHWERIQSALKDIMLATSAAGTGTSAFVEQENDDDSTSETSSDDILQTAGSHVSTQDLQKPGLPNRSDQQ